MSDESKHRTLPQRPVNSKNPNGNRRGVFTDHGSPVGKGSTFTADHSPDRVSLLHKGGYPICNSGCGDPIVEKFLRPPGNSPSRWHLTRGLLLCSQPNIHGSAENVNRKIKKMLIDLIQQNKGELSSPSGGAVTALAVTERVLFH